MLRQTITGFAAALAAASALGTVAQAATISLETDASRLEVGDTFEVRLVFDADSMDEILTGFNSDVLFNPDNVGLSGVSFVDPETGRNELMLPNPEFIPDFGFNDFIEGVQVFGVTSNTDEQLLAEQADEFAFAVLTFTAISSGSADIGLGLFQEFFGADFELLNLVLDETPLSVEVVPVPAAALFMLTGLAGVAARRRLA